MTTKAHQLLRGIGVLAAAAAVVLALGFVERSTGRIPVERIEVHVQGAEGIHFLDEQELHRGIAAQGVEGARLSALDLAAIETRLRNHPAVASAEVYHTLEGSLHVRVRQREPIVRVINADGSGFYIDREGWTMPLSDRATARVPVVTGDLHEPGALHGVRHVHADSLAGTHSAGIHTLAVHLHGDPLWRALADQVTIDGDGDYTLLPRVGAYRVLLGSADSWANGTLERRFRKLRTWYTRGAALAAAPRPARIDLRFNDQIVLTNR